MAEEILKEKSTINLLITRFINLEDKLNYFNELLLLNDNHILSDIQIELPTLEKQLSDFEIELLFKSEEDKTDCFLEINTGVGGTDACDFSNMLFNMYLKWCKANNFNYEIINLQNGDVAGITNVLIQIKGFNAFGWLKTESGVHRLVRISPYNANGKRQTSFSSVYVYPCINDKISIVIDDKDIRIDTFRASGAGGQHINKTDSAIRITHLPSKIVVQCQNQRSQHQNKEEAFKILKSKLYEIERLKNEAKTQNNNKTDNGWGYQIRSYVMHPYQLIKDNRSGYEISDFEGMLSGEYLTEFIKSNLK